jgi:hypothetical protein
MVDPSCAKSISKMSKHLSLYKDLKGRGWQRRARQKVLKDEPTSEKKKPAITRHLKELEDGDESMRFQLGPVIRKRQSSSESVLQGSPKVRLLSDDLEGIAMDQLDRILRLLTKSLGPYQHCYKNKNSTVIDFANSLAKTYPTRLD